MAMSGSRLDSSMTADILAALQSAYPINSSLLAAEKTALAAAQTTLAGVMAAGAPDIVTEISGHGLVSGSVTSGTGAGGTITGTVT